jgi:hypothetical protein
MRPVKFLKNTRAPNGAFYASGEIAGFPESDAASMIASGSAAAPSREDLLPIPSEWRKWAAPELCALAARIAEREVKDKASAIKVIEAEIDARERASAPPSPLPEGDGKPLGGDGA